MSSCQRCAAYVSSICDQAPGGSRPAPCVGVTEPASEERCVAVLFERYHRHVVAWACRITGSYELARDLAQEVFIKASGGIETFRGDAQVTTWLYTITRNCCRDYLRKRASRPREVDERALAAAPPVIENAALRWLEAQHAAILVRGLMQDAKLDPTEARAFRLHCGSGVPLQVVTRRLGLTNTSGARACLVSARRKLRRSAERWQRRSQRAGQAGMRLSAASMAAGTTRRAPAPRGD
jgi:RNA polymerase sigma factor (sigma-70 family)